MDLNSPTFSYSSISSDSDIYNASSPESGPRTRARASRPKPRRVRSKNPSQQRQNASEKEKLRMRDLTKALHHLRTFLPPSVAPAGQTLTKIETLRLAIRYISHLSSQLSPDGAFQQSTDQPRNKNQHKDLRPSQRNEPCAPQGAFSCSPAPVTMETWRSGDVVMSQYEPFHQTFNRIRMETERKDETEMEIPLFEEIFDSSVDSLMCPEPSTSHQNYSKTVHYGNTVAEFWTRVSSSSSSSSSLLL